MKQRDKTGALEAMRRAVLEQMYVLTPHALLEMREDRLEQSVTSVRCGRIVAICLGIRPTNRD